MAVQRNTIEFSRVIAYDRHLDPYVYGGTWNPFDRTVGADCSGCVVDILDAAVNGTAMAWSRHGLSTESWRPPAMGGSADPANGPFGTVMVDDPAQFPANAAVLIALHHGPGGGENSHMWCEIDGLRIETHGSDNTHPDGATVLNDGADYSDQVLNVRTVDTGAVYGGNNFWYLPGPIVEDGTPRVTGPSDPGAAPGRLTEAPDTIYPDVSEFQAPVDDSFLAATYADGGQQWNYRFICIRSNDGAHVDANFAANYAWCVKQCEAGLLDGFLVYYFWRPGTVAVATHMSLVNGAGGPHPMMASMIDVETAAGSNPTYDVSAQINSDHDTLAKWLGNAARVIGYGNTSDLNTMWREQPAGLRIVCAGYGSNPAYPGQIAHQYTDGTGYGGGLPEGVAPWPTCDMNSADNLTPSQFAAALGLAGGAPAPEPAPPVPAPPTPAPPPPGFVEPAFLAGLTDRQVGILSAIQLLGPDGLGWAQGGADAAAIADLEARVNAGGPLMPADIISWLKHHTSTHKAPTP